MNSQSPTKKGSYAVLPSFIMEDDSLDEGAKILYARISMYAEDGRCWASNEHFSLKQKVTIRCIQRWLKQLSVAGYIEVEVKKNGFQTLRNIWIINDFKRMFTKRTVDHPDMNYSSPRHEPQITHTNTSNTNIKTTTTVQEDKEAKEEVVVVFSEVEKQAEKMKSHLDKFVPKYGAKWGIALHVYISLIRDHGFEFVRDQLNYMLDCQQRAKEAELSPYKTNKCKPVDSPRSFLINSCNDDWALSPNKRKRKKNE